MSIWLQSLDLVGKTISSIDDDDDCVLVITFTDGTTIEVVAKGTEEQWLEVRKG